MTVLSSSAERLDPFTYVKDGEDFIYYIKGELLHNGEHGYSAVCIYYPDEVGDRIQTDSGIRYGKCAYEGLEFERSTVLSQMPGDAAQYVLEKTRYGDIFNKQFLFLSTQNIVEAYSPQQSLQQMLTFGNSALHNVSLEAVHSATNALESVDIPINSLGLYGSLVCGVVRLDREQRQLKDVDMLVRGVRYYNNVRTLAAEYPATETPLPPTVALDVKRTAAVKRRRQIAQFNIPGGNSMHCDVRLLREPEDPNDYHDTTTMTPIQVHLENARVEDADQSLSLPFAYRVSSSEGNYWWVSGMLYRSIGAAAVGDIVSIHGLRINSDTVLVSHPSNDWIHLA